MSDDDKSKGGEVLPPDDRDTRFIDALSRLASPFAQSLAKSQTDTAKINADMSIELERERTKQLDKRIGIAREVERRIAWFEFSVIAFVCLAFGACLGVGLWRADATLVGIGASGITGFVAGVGFRTVRRPPPQ
jgi:hypothetical protein